MKLISGCMITKNEAEYLKWSIESFLPYVDELIIVDDQSTDGTLDIINDFAQKHRKVRLVQGVYNGKKADQRNEYLKHATGKWIFCPDGDEVYTTDQMMQLTMHWRDESSDALFHGFRLQNFWKDYRHVIHGHVWDAIMQRSFRNVPGCGYFDTHHSVSIRPGINLAKWANESGRMINFQNFFVPHYSYTKSARQIMGKIRYYMRRDNPNCSSEQEVNEYANAHPFFSELYTRPRYGRQGLYCCGSHGHQKDHVEWYDGDHPAIMRTHPNWSRLHDYPAGMNKYMVDHWQHHNHLTHDRHQTRIKLAGSCCVGRTLEVGCANGYSTWLMNESCRNNSQSFAGVEPTDWGYQQAIQTYRGISFYKFYGENLPFADGEFDTVLQAEIIEHCEDPRRLADEGWRVAGKRYVVTTPTGIHGDPDHKRYYRLEQMREFLAPYGVAQFTGLTRDGKLAETENEIYFMIAWVDKS